MSSLNRSMVKYQRMWSYFCHFLMELRFLTALNLGFFFKKVLQLNSNF